MLSCPFTGSHPSFYPLSMTESTCIHCRSHVAGNRYASACVSLFVLLRYSTVYRFIARCVQRFVLWFNTARTSHETIVYPRTPIDAQAAFNDHVVANMSKNIVRSCAILAVFTDTPGIESSSLELKRYQQSLSLLSHFAPLCVDNYIE